jgi:septal ring factor EnvC (AmiA/AmiB activator)
MADEAAMRELREGLRELKEDFRRVDERWSKHKEARDGEQAEIRDAIATLDAHQGESERAIARISDQLQSLLDRKPPGVLQLWGPTLSTAVALATLFVFVLNQDRKPLESEIHRVDREVAGLVETMKVFADRQWKTYGQQEYERGRREMQEKRVDDIDKHGSRKWVDDK